MFGIILISAGTILNLYVFWRASSVPVLRRTVGPKGLIAISVLFWLLLLAGRMLGHRSDRLLTDLLDISGMTGVAILFLIAVPLAALDAVTCFGILLRKTVPQLRGAAIVIGIALSAIALIQGARSPMATRYDVELAGLPGKLDGTVIVGLADLHLRSQRDLHWLRDLVAETEALRPDVIVLLGDICEGHGMPSMELVDGLKGLNAPMGVWAVLGNHEFHGSGDGIVPLFRKAGITVLRNEKVTVRPGLVLAGVDDLTMNRRSGANADLITRALAKPSPGATVLLSHTPWSAERAAKDGAGLMLCGHTHGGQIWPFGYIVRLVYPLLAGRYDMDNMTVIVSRGAGSWGPPMRLWQRGEIIRVTLRAKKKEA
jgi:predicted MPP superfamily phosphohydrolase